MLDPYMVLGVGKYDDDQTVKKAYRQLSKQYHPDNNLNNPNKAAAEETFKKVQQAYEQIMHERSLGIGGPNDYRRNQSERSETGSSSWNSGSQSSGSSWNSSSQSSNSSWSSSSSWNNNSRTAEKERNNYKSSFWNSTWNNNSSNNDNNYSSNSSSYNNNSGYGTGTNGYYSGNGGYSYSRNTGSSNNNSNGGSGYYSGNYNYNQYNSSYGPDVSVNEDVDSILNTVAQKLNKRSFFEAWDILNSMKNRNDVWYYYSAIANLGLGNSITALNHARTAKAMQPQRPEYDELINGIQSGTIHYRGMNEMFVPQKNNSGNTCLKIGLAMLFFNVFCGGGGAICGSIGVCC